MHAFKLIMPLGTTHTVHIKPMNPGPTGDMWRAKGFGKKASVNSVIPLVSKVLGRKNTETWRDQPDLHSNLAVPEVKVTLIITICYQVNFDLWQTFSGYSR